MKAKVGEGNILVKTTMSDVLHLPEYRVPGTDIEVNKALRIMDDDHDLRNVKIVRCKN